MPSNPGSAGAGGGGSLAAAPTLLLLGCALVRSWLGLSAKLVRPAELIVFNSFLHKVGDTITSGELRPLGK